MILLEDYSIPENNFSLKMNVFVYDARWGRERKQTEHWLLHDILLI